jgi:hypothetical protein
MHTSIQFFQYSNQNDASKGQLEIKVVKKMDVMGSEITVTTQNGQDYICLTDMVKAKDGEFFISDWLRNRNTIEFLGIWGTVYNAAFNHGEFAVIKNQAGLNSYKLSVKEWTRKTHAIGLQATAGRNGGTYAHKDIAFEFGMWISPKFKIYLIKEFQRLKDEESRASSSDWSFQRTLAKVNYKIHTDAIKEHLIPSLLTSAQTNTVYASEADLLNAALFGRTASQWRDTNPLLGGNMRDHAQIEQLVVLSNLESINAVFIHQGIEPHMRLKQLNEIAISQMRSLVGVQSIRKLKK